MLSVENSQIRQEATKKMSYYKVKMILFYVIITTLTMTLAKGDFECNLSEPTGPQQCVGALGEPLIFYLPSNTKGKTSLIYNNTTIIVRVTNTTTVHIHEEYRNDSTFFINGTFKLIKVTKRNSGDYKLETFGHDGKFLHRINFHLEILDLDVLMCQVRNNVSREAEVIHLTSCTDSICVTVAVIASISTLLLHLALFICIRHLNKKAGPETVNEDNNEEEIVYSDVRVKSTRKTRPNKD